MELFTQMKKEIVNNNLSNLCRNAEIYAWKVAIRINDLEMVEIKCYICIATVNNQNRFAWVNQRHCDTFETLIQTLEIVGLKIFRNVPFDNFRLYFDSSFFFWNAYE